MAQSLPDYLTNPANPFFLHPSENPSLVLVSPKLNGKNYHSWARAMKMALLSKNKVGFISGGIVSLPAEDLLFLAWERCNTIVLGWIHRSTDDSIARSILWIDKAFDAWNDLKVHFAQSDIFRVSDIQEDMNKLQQGSMSITQYFTELKTLGIGLNEQYAHVRSQIMMIDPIPNVARAFSLVIQQERHLQSEAIVEVSSDLRAYANISDNRNKPYYGRGRGGNSANSGRGGTRICTHCGKKNHTVGTCYQIHGFPPGYRNLLPMRPRNAANHIAFGDFEENANDESKNVQNSNLSLTSDQYHQLMNLLQSSHPQSQASMQEITTPASNHFKTLVTCLASNAKNDEKSGNGTVQWLLDTGATDHVTSARSLFSSLHPITPLSITLPDGSCVQASYYGIIHISPLLTLFNVLYVPEFKTSTKKTIGTVKAKDGLFLAKQHRLPFPSSITKSTNVFQLLHADIWGPYSVPSIHGYRYFLTLVDDFSKFTWVILMKTKSEVRTNIQNFVAYIETQFNTNLKTFRSDNGLEFIMPNFFDSKDQPQPTEISSFPIFLPNTDTDLFPISSSNVNTDIIAPPASHVSPDHPRRSTRQRTQPHYLRDYHCSLSNAMVHQMSSGTTSFPVSHVISYNRCSPNFTRFCLSTMIHTEPKTYAQASKHPSWQQEMTNELQALELNKTWSMVDIPPDKHIIGCK
ncbi:uncharacterized protein LOC133315841 [Gastrolobium bilobum]|uniref:uncharacterized protein LOC133315841 n=1 Tax=Gastrolobium bilobum TaxID=150636 RepID=UPI002AB0A373|nr:uncharacterized protein LOC133315841 [Gastrolobium bilobum]